MKFLTVLRKALARLRTYFLSFVRNQWLFLGVTLVLIVVAFWEDFLIDRYGKLALLIHKTFPTFLPLLNSTQTVPAPVSNLSRQESAFMQGVVQSLIASVWFAWLLFTFRRFIRTIFQPETKKLRTPISAAVTPIIFGKTKSLWEENDVPIEVEFRNTGRKALDDLFDGKCDIAVAGDYAICAFLAEKVGFAHWPRNKYKLLPFAKIKDQVKLLVPPGGKFTDQASLQGQAIAFWPHSIHDEFLQEMGLRCTSTTPADASLLHFISATSSGQAAACVVVEPYYIAFEHAQYQVIQSNKPIEWYMCLVLTADFLDDKPEFERRFKRAAKQACDVSDKDWENAIRSCADYVLQEFTGISADDMISKIRKENLSFKFPTKEEFLGRVGKLSELAETRDGAALLVSNPECIII